MKRPDSRPVLGTVIFYSLAVVLGGYFTFAAVQGDYGVFRRVALTAEARSLTDERDRLQAEEARMENLTLRLSDNYLDLDLLDERARDVLGYIRIDEIVLR
jgi:cell division protein FtsB